MERLEIWGVREQEREEPHRSPVRGSGGVDRIGSKEHGDGAVRPIMRLVSGLWSLLPC
jgi:hypothetical protein